MWVTRALVTHKVQGLLKTRSKISQVFCRLVLVLAQFSTFTSQQPVHLDRMQCWNLLQAGDHTLCVTCYALLSQSAFLNASVYWARLHVCKGCPTDCTARCVSFIATTGHWLHLHLIVECHWRSSRLPLSNISLSAFWEYESLQVLNYIVCTYCWARCVITASSPLAACIPNAACHLSSLLFQSDAVAAALRSKLYGETPLGTDPSV